MRANILPSYIRDEFLIAMRIAVEDEGYFSSLAIRTHAFCTKKQSKLQRHVEARESVSSVELRPREVMDSQPTLFDDSKYLIDTDLAAIINFKSAARPEAAMDCRKRY
jgi:hypothetical protein